MEMENYDYSRLSNKHILRMGDNMNKSVWLVLGMAVLSLGGCHPGAGAPASSRISRDGGGPARAPSHMVAPTTFRKALAPPMNTAAGSRAVHRTLKPADAPLTDEEQAVYKNEMDTLLDELLGEE